jgi:hypothetical protein
MKWYEDSTKRFGKLSVRLKYEQKCFERVDKETFERDLGDYIQDDFSNATEVHIFGKNSNNNIKIIVYTTNPESDVEISYTKIPGGYTFEQKDVDIEKDGFKILGSSPEEFRKLGGRPGKKSSYRNKNYTHRRLKIKNKIKNKIKRKTKSKRRLVKKYIYM